MAKVKYSGRFSRSEQLRQALAALPEVAAGPAAGQVDLADPAVQGPRPTSWRLVNAYINRLLPVAQRDPEVANAFLEVNAMVAKPKRIMRPRIAVRVLRGGWTTGPGAAPVAPEQHTAYP